MEQDHSYKKQNEKKATEMRQWIYIGSGLFVLLPLVFFVWHSIQSTNKTVFSLSFLVLIAGLILEYKNMASWKTLLVTVMLAFLLSFILLVITGGKTNSLAGTYVVFWPYSFFVSIIIVAVIRHFKEAMPKISEGIVLLQSLAIIYWTMVTGLHRFNHVLIIILLLSGFILFIYSLYHGLVYDPLYDETKLTLSIFSSVIIVFFGVDNALAVLHSNQIENANSLPEVVFLTIQYFVLGMSSIYIAKSIAALVGFMPSKGESKSDYRKRLKLLKTLHISRVDDAQVKRAHIIVVLLFSILTYGTNSYFKLFPVNFVIWGVFLSYPAVIYGYERLLKRSNEAPILLSKEELINNKPTA